MIERVSALVADFPEISEMDLNPVFATEHGATAADVRIVLDFTPAPPRYRPSQAEIVEKMTRIMKPKALAVIGASDENGKIGNSVMKNLINGGYQGEIYPIHPSAESIMGKKAYKSVKDVPADIDVAVFAIPAKFVAQALTEVGEKKIAGRHADPFGICRDRQRRGPERTGGNRPQVRRAPHGPQHLRLLLHAQQPLRDLLHRIRRQRPRRAVLAVGRHRHGDHRFLAFRQDGRLRDRRRSATSRDIDEDDLLTFFEQDDNTTIIAQHCEDLKDGRAFAEVAKRVSKKKPIVVLKAGRTSMGARAASSHTGALAGNDKIYEDVFKQSGVIRARSLRDLLDFARGIPVLPTPKGNNVVIITGAGGSGVLLSDACVDNGLSLMAMPADLDAAFRKFIPPFGAAGNPVDITGGEPPSTYQNTVRLGLQDPRIHALILGYWHTIITPPMVFAKLMVEVVDEMRAKGFEKPVVASLAGDIEVEEAAEYLYQHGIPAYAYSTEIPVAVLGAKYKWARGAGLIPNAVSPAGCGMPCRTRPTQGRQPDTCNSGR